MAKPQDHYEVLQVHPSVHPDVIQSAYRRLALLYHPDTNPAPEAVEMMSRLNEAYEVLSDPQRRAAYDRQRGIQRDDESADNWGFANSASSVRSPGKGSRKSAQHSVEIPVRQAFKSAAAILRWQVGFFGRPISAIAAAVALAANAPLVLFSPFTLPIAVISFFWIWFLASATLYFGWNVIGNGFTYLKSIPRRLRRAGDGAFASTGGPVRGVSSGPAAEKGRRYWKELTPHLAVLGRAAGRAMMRLVRFFGWPISISAAATILLSVVFYVSTNLGSGTLSPLDSGGRFVTSVGRLLILVIGAPVFVTAAFLAWLFLATLLLMACSCLKPREERLS